ncbi:MAG: 2-amino-4-hydroxy-6-hydroxymethyldihydropteridine diphosphokinase [Fimbriiglobus sp.]
MPRVFVGIGSNLGERQMLLHQAISRLRAEPGLRVVAVSEWYETQPVGGPAGQGAYLNGVVELDTRRDPAELLAFLHRIEAQFGRVREVKDGPRTLDLDLLFYGDQVIQTPGLVVPHPRLHERAFVLAPLVEVDPLFLHPMLKKSIQELFDELPDFQGVRLYLPQTQSTSELVGLKALVTGSTAGIGAEIANKFEASGAMVLRHGRRERTEPNYIAGDLNDRAFVDALPGLAWQGGPVDVVVLNAGADTLTGDAAKWGFERKLEELLRVDLTTTMLLGRAFGERMKARGSGSIITIGWDQAETGMEGDSGQLFGAVKAAIMAFTRSLAVSLAPEVRVNCIAPGWIRTAWGETASDVWQERVRRETPTQTWGLPADIAHAAKWLADPRSHYITGQTLRVNGGAIRG